MAYNQAVAAPRFRARFRLKAPSNAVFHRDGTDGMVEIPANEEIVVLTPLDESQLPNRQVRVEWMGQEFKMFAVDVRDRGERI